MTDLFENVALLALLLMSGVGVTVTVLIMLLKALDYFENGHE